MKTQHLASVSTLSLLSALALLGCGGSKSPAADASSTGGAESTPVDPSKPVGPKGVNAGASITNELIDDFEDKDSKNVAADMRGGYWYTYADKQSTVAPVAGEFAPAEGGAGDSKFSGRMTGTVSADEQYPFVGLGTSFTDPKQPYDASSCTGVSFKGKKTGATNSKVRVKVGDWQTSPEGGLCKQCFNDFGGDVLFTEEWVEHTLVFANMKQEPYWGEPKMAIDPTALYQIQWQVNEKGQPFDIQVDDVKFVGCKK